VNTSFHRDKDGKLFYLGMEIPEDVYIRASRLARKGYYGSAEEYLDRWTDWQYKKASWNL
jgi:hypothetical protein